MHRFWITSPIATLAIALALAAPPAFAGKLDSIKQAAQTYIAKKQSGSASHGITGGSHGKAGQFLGKGKKLLGK